MTQRPLHPFLDHPRPTAFAHRGGSLEADENTWPAFEHAVALGYTHVELDVHLTRDGVVVVHHDDTAERVFSDPRAIAEMTWDEVQTLRARGGGTVPRLDELLASFPRLHVNIELKTDTGSEALAEVIRRADALPRICVGSFEPARTQRMRQLLGEGLCWSPAHKGVAALFAAGWGLPFAVPDFPVVQVPLFWKGVPVVTRRFVKAAHQRGILVQVWTVDDGAEMKRLIDLGVDGIMTDRPTLLREVLQRRGMWPG
jgi:glycerophosphoryl diester phosphodiesterase